MYGLSLVSPFFFSCFEQAILFIVVCGLLVANTASKHVGSIVAGAQA